MKRAIGLVILAILAGSAPAESIWQRAERAGKAGNPIEDFRATREGDLLTIIVRESHKVELDEQLDRDRQASLEAALTNFDIAPNAFGTLPAIKGSSKRTFEGDAQYGKEGNFQARITVRVVDTLPNGTLVVSGKRTLIMDGEQKTLRLAGLIRPADITASNTVLSEQVADARISFKGKGTVSRATDPGMLDGFWHTVISLLPF